MYCGCIYLMNWLMVDRSQPVLSMIRTILHHRLVHHGILIRSQREVTAVGQALIMDQWLINENA